MVFQAQLSNASGIVRLCIPKLTPYPIHGMGISRLNSFASVRGKVEYKQSQHGGCHHRRVSVGRISGQTSSSSFHEQQLPEEPFWLGFLKDIFWSMRSMFYFLGEQPGQVKYIEWPSFKSTLKTATLSLGLVAVFIVALSSVDSALSYILALFLRKAP